MELTAAERVLLHLHGFWNAREPGREGTQAGIAEGARLLRSHVPRTLKGLQGEGFVEARDARLLGRNRKVRVYGNTAIVTREDDVKGHMSSNEISGTYRDTVVYVKGKNGQWQDVNFQSTKVQTPGK